MDEWGVTAVYHSTQRRFCDTGGLEEGDLWKRSQKCYSWKAVPVHTRFLDIIYYNIDFHSSCCPALLTRLVKLREQRKGRIQEDSRFNPSCMDNILVKRVICCMTETLHVFIWRASLKVKTIDGLQQCRINRSFPLDYISSVNPSEILDCALVAGADVFDMRVFLLNLLLHLKKRNA